MKNIEMNHCARHLIAIILLCGQFLIANAFASTIPGTGTAALIGGDLSDPANSLDNTAGTTTASAIPTLWVSASATSEPGFSPAEGNDVPTRDPDIWSIDGCNDGVSWTPIYTYNNNDISPFTARLQVIRFDGNGVDFLCTCTLALGEQGTL